MHYSGTGFAIGLIASMKNRIAGVRHRMRDDFFKELLANGK